MMPIHVKLRPLRVLQRPGQIKSRLSILYQIAMILWHTPLYDGSFKIIWHRAVGTRYLVLTSHF